MYEKQNIDIVNTSIYVRVHVCGLCVQWIIGVCVSCLPPPPPCEPELPEGEGTFVSSGNTAATGPRLDISGEGGVASGEGLGGVS